MRWAIGHFLVILILDHTIVSYASVTIDSTFVCKNGLGTTFQLANHVDLGIVHLGGDLWWWLLVRRITMFMKFSLLGIEHTNNPLWWLGIAFTHGKWRRLQVQPTKFIRLHTNLIANYHLWIRVVFDIFTSDNELNIYLNLKTDGEKWMFVLGKFYLECQ